MKCSLNKELFDGCYIVRTDATSEHMNTEEAVNGYKSLAGVEKAFRSLKTVSLEIRPVYHKSDDRIRAHVFLCMLSYYIQWHGWSFSLLYLKLMEADVTGDGLCELLLND